MQASRRFKAAQTSHCTTIYAASHSDLVHAVCEILSDRALCKTLHMCKQVYTKSLCMGKKAVNMCILKHVNIGRGTLTLLTHSYLFPLSSPALHRLVAVRPLSLWQPWHQQRAAGQVLFERGSEWKEEMEDKKRLRRREGKKLERRWKEKRECCILSREDFAGVCGYPHFITVCYQATAACRPACLRSIPSLTDEVRALGQLGHVCTSAGNTPPNLSSHFLLFCPYLAAFLFDSKL